VGESNTTRGGGGVPCREEGGDGLLEYFRNSLPSLGEKETHHRMIMLDKKKIQWKINADSVETALPRKKTPTAIQLGKKASAVGPFGSRSRRGKEKRDKMRTAGGQR